MQQKCCACHFLFCCVLCTALDNCFSSTIFDGFCICVSCSNKHTTYRYASMVVCHQHGILFHYYTHTALTYTTTATSIIDYFPNQFFFTSTLVPSADPFGTFLNRNLGAPQGGHLYLSSNSAHALGPLV
jgi:hypothetical protein